LLLSKNLSAVLRESAYTFILLLLQGYLQGKEAMVFLETAKIGAAPKRHPLKII